MKYLEGILATVGFLCCMAVDSPDQYGMAAAIIGIASFAATGAIEKRRKA
jgi:hypothetical protein